jgi:hypothetical protein
LFSNPVAPDLHFSSNDSDCNAIDFSLRSGVGDIETAPPLPAGSEKNVFLYQRRDNDGFVVKGTPIIYFNPYDEGEFEYQLLGFSVTNKFAFKPITQINYCDNRSQIIRPVLSSVKQVHMLKNEGTRTLLTNSEIVNLFTVDDTVRC